MSYSNFTMEILKKNFALTITEQSDFFAHIDAITISDFLANTLKENVPLALAINTEKSRSEMIISPILIEIRRLLNHQISLFSGVKFNIDKDKGLLGICDYIICRSAEQLTINAPVISMVEAKNENIKAGIPQCIAEMLGAQFFNEQRGSVMNAIYGSVTTGSNWKFLKLTNNIIYIDLTEYSIREPGKIIGILLSMLI